MTAQHLAMILLGLRVVSTILLVAVLVKQIKNIRTTTTDYRAVRMTVFIFTLILLLGQIIPIVLDATVSFNHLYPGRTNSPTLLGSAYTLNNAMKDVFMGALLTFLHYRPAAEPPNYRR